MSLANYTELQAAIAAWLARAGDTIITTPAPDFITLAEARINYGSGEPGEPFYSPPLRVEQMLTRATATPTGEYIAVPTDFLEMREFKVNTNPETKLYYSTPQQFAEAASSQNTGTPKTYTIVGGEFRLGPTPTSGLTTELLYYAKVGPLSTTNWLMTAAPNVYLYGSLLEACIFTQDAPEQCQYYFGLFAAAVKALQLQDRRRKFGGSPLVMRSGMQTP